MQTKYKVFLESLVISILILMIGVFIGFFVESYRTAKIVEYYKDYEIQALDLKLQNYYYQIMNASSCQQAIEQNFIFADDIYNQGLVLEKYEEANQISDDLLREKKRYVLLKTELWLNSLLLKEKCGNPFDTIVYFYSGDPKSSGVIAQQKIISNVLKSVKEEKGNKVILLPIAGDLDLKAVELQMKIYGIKSLPSILINEKDILKGFNTEEKIISYLEK